MNIDWGALSVMLQDIFEEIVYIFRSINFEKKINYAKSELRKLSPAKRCPYCKQPYVWDVKPINRKGRFPFKMGAMCPHHPEHRFRSTKIQPFQSIDDWIWGANKDFVEWAKDNELGYKYCISKPKHTHVFHSVGDKKICVICGEWVLKNDI